MRCWKCTDGQVKVECWRCKGEAYLIENCSHCNGGRVKCWTCDGTGKDSEGNDHSACDGRGWTECDAFGCEAGKVKRECPTCHGEGWEKETCVTCGGDDQID